MPLLSINSKVTSEGEGEVYSGNPSTSSSPHHSPAADSHPPEALDQVVQSVAAAAKAPVVAVFSGVMKWFASSSEENKTAEAHRDEADQLFAEKKYAEAAKEYQLAIETSSVGGLARIGLWMLETQQGLGQCYFHLDDYSKASQIYGKILEKDSRDLDIRRLRLETNQELMKGIDSKKDGKFSEKIQQEILADQAMILAIHADEAKEDLVKIEKALDKFRDFSLDEKKEKLNVLSLLSQHHLELASQQYSKNKDTEFVRNQLNGLASQGFIILSKLAENDTAPDIKKLSSLYKGYGLLADGKVDEGVKVLESIRATVPEANAILKNMDHDSLHVANLAALDIWAVRNAEGEKIIEAANDSVNGIITGTIDYWTRSDGKTIHHDNYEGTRLENNLVAELRRKISKGEAATIQEALKKITESGPEELKEKAKLYLTHSQNSQVSDNTMGILIAYCSKLPPDPAIARHLLDNTFHYEANQNAIETSYSLYAILNALSPEADIKTKTKEHMEALSGNSSIARSAAKFWKTTSVTEVLVDVAMMRGFAMVGSFARLAMLEKLSEAGVTGYKAIGIAYGVGTVVEGNLLFGWNTTKAVMNEDVKQVFSLKHLAKSYGATLVMLGLTKGFSAVGNATAAPVAKGLGMVAEGQLTTGGKVLGAIIGHTAGLGGMIASTKVNQALHLQEKALGGWKESLTHDVLGYIQFAIAHQGVDKVTDGKLAHIEHGQHTKIAIREAILKAQALADRLGHKAEKGADGKWNRPTLHETLAQEAAANAKPVSGKGPSPQKPLSPEAMPANERTKAKGLTLAAAAGVAAVATLPSKKAQAKSAHTETLKSKPLHAEVGHVAPRSPSETGTQFMIDGGFLAAGVAVAFFMRRTGEIFGRYHRGIGPIDVPKTEKHHSVMPGLGALAAIFAGVAWVMKTNPAVHSTVMKYANQAEAAMRGLKKITPEAIEKKVQKPISKESLIEQQEGDLFAKKYVKALAREFGVTDAGFPKSLNGALDLSHVSVGDAREIFKVLLPFVKDPEVRKGYFQKILRGDMTLDEAHELVENLQNPEAVASPAASIGFPAAAKGKPFKTETLAPSFKPGSDETGVKVTSAPAVKESPSGIQPIGKGSTLEPPTEEPLQPLIPLKAPLAVGQPVYEEAQVLLSKYVITETGEPTPALVHLKEWARWEDPVAVEALSFLKQIYKEATILKGGQDLGVNAEAFREGTQTLSQKIGRAKLLIQNSEEAHEKVKIPSNPLDRNQLLLDVVNKIESINPDPLSDDQPRWWKNADQIANYVDKDPIVNKLSVAKQAAKLVMAIHGKLQKWGAMIAQKESGLKQMSPKERAAAEQDIETLYFLLKKNFVVLERWKSFSGELQKQQMALLKFTWPFQYADFVREKRNAAGTSTKAKSQKWVTEELGSLLKENKSPETSALTEEGRHLENILANASIPVEFTLLIPEWHEDTRMIADYFEGFFATPKSSKKFEVKIEVKDAQDQKILVDKILNDSATLFPNQGLMIAKEGPNTFKVQTPNGVEFAVRIEIQKGKGPIFGTKNPPPLAPPREALTGALHSLMPGLELLAAGLAVFGLTTKTGRDFVARATKAIEVFLHTPDVPNNKSKIGGKGGYFPLGEKVEALAKKAGKGAKEWLTTKGPAVLDKILKTITVHPKIDEWVVQARLVAVDFKVWWKQKGQELFGKVLKNKPTVAPETETPWARIIPSDGRLPRFYVPEVEAVVSPFKKLIREALILGLSGEYQHKDQTLSLVNQAKKLVDALRSQVSPELGNAFRAFLGTVYHSANDFKKPAGQDYETTFSYFAGEVAGLVKETVESGKVKKPDYQKNYAAARALLAKYGFSKESPIVEGLLSLASEAHRSARRLTAPLLSTEQALDEKIIDLNTTAPGRNQLSLDSEAAVSYPYERPSFRNPLSPAIIEALKRAKAAEAKDPPTLEIKDPFKGPKTEEDLPPTLRIDNLEAAKGWLSISKDIFSELGFGKDPELMKIVETSKVDLQDAEVVFDHVNEGLRHTNKGLTPDELATAQREVMKLILEGKINEASAKKFKETCEKWSISQNESEKNLGKAFKEALDKALGRDLSKKEISELEGRLGIPKSDWILKILQDPQEFFARHLAINCTEGVVYRLLSNISNGDIEIGEDGTVLKGHNLIQSSLNDIAGVQQIIEKRLGVDKVKLPLSSAELLIQIALIAQHGKKLGIVGDPIDLHVAPEGGISHFDFTRLLATLYLRNAPPLVSKERLEKISTLSDPTLRRAEFLKALLQRETVTPPKAAGKADLVDFTQEVDFLAAGETPFAAAARELKAGKISVETYHALQADVAKTLVEGHFPAFAQVKTFLEGLQKIQNSLHIISTEGRMKNPSDLIAKLIRRAWTDHAPLTDIGGIRVVVKTNADAKAVVAKIRQYFPIRELYSKDGDMELDVIGDHYYYSDFDKVEVVELGAKFDMDGTHRLVHGHPESGYRALHVVVDVGGFPVEIQIKTEAMAEWGVIQHKLVYKNNDLPEHLLRPIKLFCKQAADYLDHATHLQPGEKLESAPKPPILPFEIPSKIRAEMQKGIQAMVGLMN